MALVANRTEARVLDLSQAPDTWGQGIGAPYLEQQFYDHPYPKVSILLKEVKQFTDQAGSVISRDVDTWEYDELTRAPRSHLKEVWALAYLPGVNYRSELVKIHEERTIYLVQGWLTGGPMGHLKTRSGWVIYDLKPAPTPLTPAQQAKVVAKGIDPTPRRYTGDVELRINPDSGRPVQPAIDQAAIVEKATAPQIALWREPYEVEELTLEEDWQKIVEWTIKKNFLQPGPPQIERREQLKDPRLVQLPLDLLPPVIKAANAAGQGVRIEIKGGGADLANVSIGFNRFIQHVRPESYVVYRKVTVQPVRPPTGDLYGLYAADPAYVDPGIGRPLEDTAVRDLAGAPASPLPSAVSYSEPESPTPPVPDVWDRIAEIPNDEKDDRLPGRAIVFDSAVESGGTYEYFAVAVLGTQESPQSNHETVSYTGGLSFTSGIRTTVLPSPDGSLQIDIVGPPLPGIPDGYGETQYHTVPAILGTAPATGGWQAGALISDPATLGQEIGLRKLVHESAQERVTVPLNDVLLNIERGQRVKLPEVSWETYGNDLHLSSEVVAAGLMLEGFRAILSRQGQAITVDPGSLELELP